MFIVYNNYALVIIVFPFGLYFWGYMRLMFSFALQFIHFGGFNMFLVDLKEHALDWSSCMLKNV